MADRDYHIDWSADITPALALLGQSRRAKEQMAMAAEQNKLQNARSDAHLEFQRQSHRENMERASHELERQKDLDKRKRAIEDFNARDALFRTAQRSPEAASQNPYGYTFEARNDLPANVEGPELSPAAEAARFQLAGGPNAKAGAPVQAEPPIPQAAPDFSRPHMPSVSADMRGAPQAAGLVPIEMEPSQAGPGLAGLDEDAAMRNVSAAMNRQVNEPQAMPQVAGMTSEPPQTASAAAHMLGMEPGPEGKRRVFASYGGKQFELPGQPTTSGFGAKYDAIYQRFLQEPGITPEEALNAVTKMAHEDAVESGRDRRAEAAEDARSQRDAQYRMDIAGQFEQQRRQLEQSDKNSRRAAQAGGGVVRVGALQDFVKAANDLKPGEAIPPQIAALGVSAGFKPNQIAAEADRYRNSDTKSMKGSGGGVLGLKEIAPLNTSIDNIDKLIGQIEANPKAWDEYKDNSLSWKRGEGFRGTTVGKALQAGRLMDVAPEQGLKSEQAKTLHQRQERLNTDIAKSFGGVITEGDRNAAASNQANFALDATQKIAQLREMRDSLVAKRNVFTQSRAAGSGGGNDALKAKAERALQDPNAPPEAKAAARKILGR
jgi:hypothetical protein